MQRKLDQQVLIEELRGRVGALTLKMGRLGNLLTGLPDNMDDFIPFVNQKLVDLEENKANKTMLTDLEQKLMDMGVGGGESMSNALQSMEGSIDDLAAKVAELFATQVDLSQVTGETDKVEERIQEEIDKLAAEIVRVYRTTDERIDGVDEVKAEKDWIEDLMTKIRRQVGALKKKVGEGGGAPEGMMSALQGSLQQQLMVKVIPTPLHVLDRISPIFSPFFPVFCAFSPSRRGGSNEPKTGTQGHDTVARAPKHRVAGLANSGCWERMGAALAAGECGSAERRGRRSRYVFTGC